MRIIVQNSSDVPIYQQIYDQIKEAIRKRQLKEDDLLPSIRQLARELKISVITTTRAYTDLEKDGYIMIVQGKGCFVKGLNEHALKESLLQEFEKQAIEAIHAAKLMHKTKEEAIALFTTLLEEQDYDKCD